MSSPVFSAELDRAYDQAAWASNMEEVIQRYGLLSEQTRTAIGRPQRIAYGTGPDEGFDWYKAGTERAPAVVFVHGGAWRRGAAKDYAFPAQMLIPAGIGFIGLDFSAVTDAGGELAILVDQVRRAVAWVFQNGGALGVDPQRIVLVGHSSGAHLAAMTLSTDWARYPLPANPIKAGMLISGVYDLGPLRRTARSGYMRIDDAIERAFSPLHHVSSLQSPILLAAASADSPEFVRQAKTYASAARNAGKDISFILGEGYNHFEILETLASPQGFLGRSLIELIKANA